VESTTPVRHVPRYETTNDIWIFVLGMTKTGLGRSTDQAFEWRYTEFSPQGLDDNSINETDKIEHEDKQTYTC